MMLEMSPAADEAAGPSFVGAAELAAAAEGEFVEKIDDADIADVEGGEAFVGGEIERIRNEAGGVVGGGLVEGVAVVESFGESVGAAKREAVAEAAAKVYLQSVVGADAFGEPRPGVRDGGIGFFCADGNVEGAGGNGGACERRADEEAEVGIVGGAGGKSWVPSWENGRARRGGANDGRRFVGIDADEFVIAVRADVADGDAGVGRDFVFELERPGDERGRLHVGLDAAGDELCGRWDCGGQDRSGNLRSERTGRCRRD